MQSDVHPDLQSVIQEHNVCFIHKADLSDLAGNSVCGAQKKAQTETNVGNALHVIVQLQDLGPETIKRLSESFPSTHANFSVQSSEEHCPEKCGSRHVKIHAHGNY